MHKQITLKPRLSEKTYTQSAKRVYAFDVPSDVNKHDVGRAVAAQFEVEVSEVNILNRKGKAKRSISQGGRRQSKGRDSAIKKAYVTLKKGHELPFFQAIDEAEAKQAETQAKLDKATEKAAAKDAKADAKPRRGLHLGRRPAARKEES